MIRTQAGPVLVVGATGFIGRTVMAHLADHGIARAGLGRSLLVDQTGSIAHLEADWDTLVAEIEPSAVVFVAGSSAVTGLEAELVANHLAPLERILAVAERAWEARPPFVFASTGLVYGRQLSARPISETDLVNPGSPYAEVKLACERRVNEATAAGVVDGRVARFFNLAGPGQSAGIVADLVRQLAASNVAKQVELLSASPILDILDVRDAAAAILAMLSAPCLGSPSNVCSGRAVTTDDLIAAAMRATGQTIDVTYRDEAGPPEALIGSFSRLHDATGWQPFIALDRTIADALAAWSQGST